MTLNIIELSDLPPVQGSKIKHNPWVAVWTMIQPARLLGENILAVEVGVSKAHSSVCMLDFIPNMKKLVLIDHWQPFEDEFENPKRNDGIYTQERQDKIYASALQKLLSNPNKDKVTILKNNTEQAVEYFPDNSIDFLFLDSYIDKKSVEDELERWYNKVKINGIFSGHDYSYPDVKSSVDDFREKYSITAPFSEHHHAWCWIKDRNI